MEEQNNNQPDREIIDREILGSSVKFCNIELTSSTESAEVLCGFAVQLFDIINKRKKDGPGYTG